MHQVPVIEKSIFGGVLAHRGNPDPVAQRDFAKCKWREQHLFSISRALASNSKITASYSFPDPFQPHPQFMGYHAKPILLGMFASALAFAGQDAVEMNRKAAQFYDQARYPEAETLFRRALTAFESGGRRDPLHPAIPTGK